MQKMGWFGVVVGAAATKSPPPVIYCEVGVSQFVMSRLLLVKSVYQNTNC